MGRQSRRKRERRLQARPPDHRQPLPPSDHRRAFQAAMFAEHLEDMAARDTVCIVCERPDPAYVGTWFVAPEFGRTIGVPDGKTRVYVYRLCEDCGARAKDGDAWTDRMIEASILARERGESFVALGGDGMPIIDPGTEPLPAATPI